jgi:hypothetical protein
MIRRGTRRPAGRKNVASRLVPLGSAFACAVLAALAARPTRAQTFASPIDSIVYMDSMAHAESLRVQDSTHVADSLAAEEEAAFAEAEGAFSGATSILDRSRPQNASPFIYNTNYSLNRGNRNWSQSADVRLKPGNLEVGNVTTMTIGREQNRTNPRISRRGETRTELAYRVSPWLRLGGGLGLNRFSDRSGSTTATVQQDNDDASAQALFNSTIGQSPIRGSASIGYLKSEQRDLSSRGTSTNLFASTSRTWNAGSRVSLDASQQFSRLSSTVPDSAGYSQNDRNSNTNVTLRSAVQFNRWSSLDFTGSTQRSRIERPALLPLDEDDPSVLTVVPERVLGQNDNLDGSVRLQLPRQGSLTVRAAKAQNEQVYSAEIDRSSVAKRTSFTADATVPTTRFAAGTISYENTLSDNDYTRRDPGYVESALLRRLEANLSRGLGPRTSARLTAGMTLTRRRYGSYTSSFGTDAPSGQDQLRSRASLNLSYRPGTRFDTGLTLAIEENDVVNLSSTASINNARQRSYGVTWLWNAKPGDIWSVTQSNNATAVQQYFNFTPDRDQLSFIYNLNTTVIAQLMPTVRLETQHTARIQSRGSWRFVENQRRFGKANEFNSFDLNLRAVYTPKSWLTLEAQERLTSSPNYTFAHGVGTKVTESRRTEFTLLGRTSYSFSRRATLNGDLRRILSTDRSRSFGVIPSDVPTNNDYWFGTISFRMEFFP